MKLKYNDLKSPIRVDNYIYKSLNDSLSRSKICELIKNGNLEINNKVIKKCSYKIFDSGEINFNNEIELNNKILIDDKDKNYKLNIIFENNNYIIIDKPDNLVVHPGVNNNKNTLVNILISKNKELSKIDTDRPGIVHRLDKNTTGIILIAKNEKFHQYIQKQFENRKVKKIYLGVVKGEMKYKSGEINAPIGRDEKNRKLFKVKLNNSKDSITKFKVLDNINGNDLLEFELITGRTHQIRVHMKYLGNPLLNDLDYGTKIKGCYRKGQLLHSHKLEFLDLENKLVSYVSEINFDKILKE